MKKLHKNFLHDLYLYTNISTPSLKVNYLTQIVHIFKFILIINKSLNNIKQ